MHTFTYASMTNMRACIIFIYIYIYTYIYIYAQIYTLIHASVLTCMHTLHACTHACMYVCMYAPHAYTHAPHIYIPPCIHTHVHAQVLTPMHTYVHARINAPHIQVHVCITHIHKYERGFNTCLAACTLPYITYMHVSMLVYKHMRMRCKHARACTHALHTQIHARVHHINTRIIYIHVCSIEDACMQTCARDTLQTRMHIYM